MSKFAHWKAKRFRTTAGGTLIAVVIVGACWFPLYAYAHRQAAAYASMAAHEPDASRAIGEYQVAHALNAGDSAYRIQLATLYASRNEPEKAVQVLGSSDTERMQEATLLIQLGRYSAALAALQPLGTPAAAAERSNVYLEEGSGEAAVSAVAQPSTNDERIQLGLAYMVNNKPQSVDALAKSSDAATQSTLLSLKTGKLTLAQELYSRKLYRSTVRVLAQLSDSPAKYVLLTHALLAETPASSGQVLAAQTAAQQGTKLDPANLSLHELLKDVDAQLGDQGGAAREQQLISQLQAGSI